MVDREDQSNLPPIPDGGLSESMPDWLRRPPAWRTLPDREVTAPEPEETAALPEPDDSVIDPRELLSDDDLPGWLRNLGPGRRTAAEPGSGEPQPASAGTEQPVPNRAADSTAPSRPARFVPTSPQLPVSRPVPAGARSAPELPVSRPAPSSTPSRQGAGLIAALAGLLVIAIIVIGILLVA